MVSDGTAQAVRLCRFGIQLEHPRRAGIGLLQILIVPLDRHEPDVHVLPVDQPLGREQQLALADDVLRLTNELESAFECGSGEAPDLLPREQIVFVGADVANRPLGDPPLFVRREAEAQRLDDVARQLLLNVEDVVERTAVLLGPDLCVAARVDELRRDAQIRAGAPHTAGEHEARAELARNRTHVLVAALESHRRLPRGDAQHLEHGEIGDHLVGESVGEVLALRVGVDIGKG